MSVIEHQLYYPGTFVGFRLELRTAASDLPDDFRPRTSLVRVALHALVNRFCGAQTVAKILGIPRGCGGEARQ
ncbi:hypothetical protein PEX1_028080 [Penicillium expansum]|uniref:Uncharacterized protein n=1 Tax=Penicillium expansum TaxID=27334 RepID=A0A0A2I872_PENEN|nr:hypothetical protein PEX2_030120 [Penicillium expansum]KGO39292.1 hypothetical protein PEXP_043730 [Penicillium expansum]KGO47206.1 hypothetical protein PEX1_028080 [Penicillium expansum]KGO55194.1 hypothetical protein PEX2_030120 [Penicillium expansum]